MKRSVRAPSLRTPRSTLAAALLVLQLVCTLSVRAQQDTSALVEAPAGFEAEPDELEAFWALAAERMIRARELAAKILAQRPNSYVGHFVMGQVEHDGEANFPRAVFELEQALTLFEKKHGKEPTPDSPWRWHTRILLALAFAYGEIELHEKKLAMLARYNDLYDPDRLAERAWPLMKVRRFREARAAAREGIATNDPRQREIALNALCAVEFEAGNDLASYDACKQAMDNAKALGADLDPADLMNFAEASRSVFKLDEAERIDREASEAAIAWYGNPWSELAELYIREARLAEALAALREIPRYRVQRPPHVRESDRNENRRALSSFFVVMGRAEEALHITQKALVAPDRRGHNSRDPAQDISIAALLDKAAHTLKAEHLRERVASRAWYERFWAQGHALWEQVLGWLSGRRAVRLLGENDRLAGSLRIGTSQAAVMPPWLVGGAVEVVGAGPARAAIAKNRRLDKRTLAPAYYDAFEGEALLLAGDDAEARKMLARAEKQLPAAEQLLRARVLALLALAKEGVDETGRFRDLERVMQIDPGVLRRLQMTLPVKFSGAGELGEDFEDVLDHSPRFSVNGSGLLVTVRGDRANAEACLTGVSGAKLACGQAQAQANDKPDAFLERLAADFHARVFAPHVDLSVSDANSLDGTNLKGNEQDLSPLLDGEEIR